MPVHRGCRPARRSLRRRARRRVDRTLSQCFKWIARNIRWLLCVVLGCWASVSSLVPRQTGPTVTVPENEGKRCSKRARSSRPCLPDNFDALLECRDLTQDLLIERVVRALHAWASQFPWCQHEVAHCLSCSWLTWLCPQTCLTWRLMHVFSVVPCCVCDCL